MAGTALATRRSFMSRFQRPSGGALVVRRSSGPSPKFLKLKEQLAAVRRRAAGNTQGKGMTLIQVGFVAGGGIVAAFLRKVFGDEILGMDVRLVGGVAMVSIAVLGLKKGKLAEALALGGAGVLACAVEDIAEDYIPDIGGGEDT